MWLLFLLLCSGACGILVFQTIVSYLSFEVFIKYKLAFPQRVLFPAVTICNANLFQNDQAFAFVDQVLTKDRITDPTDVEFGSESYPTEVSHLLNSYGFVLFDAQINAKNPNVSDITRQSFGSNLTNFILSCYFGSTPCSTSDFTWFYDFTYGNCFKFNGDGSKVVSKPGNQNGLTFILLTRIKKNLNSLAQSLGSHLFIHNQTIEPYSAGGINVAPGTQTNIAITTTYQNQLGLPYNNCYKNLVAIEAYDSVLYRNIISNNRTYRQTDCFRLCFQQQVVYNCNCYNSNSPKIGDSPPCTTFRELACAFGVYVDFYSKSVIDQCGDLW